jgi:hypothetical protein
LTVACILKLPCQNYDPEKFQREFKFKLDLLSNKTKVKITPKQNTTKGEIK